MWYSKGYEQVKAAGTKIDGAGRKQRDSRAISERYERRRCNRLKIAGRARIIYRAARSRLDKRARNALNRVSPEFEAGPGDWCQSGWFVRLHTRTGNMASRMGDARTKPCVYVCTRISVVAASPVVLPTPSTPPGVCTITVYIIGAGQHVDRERPLLHQTPWSSSTDPFTANLPTIATLHRVYKRLDTSAIPNGTAYAEHDASCSVIRFLAADLSAAPSLKIGRFYVTTLWSFFFFSFLLFFFFFFFFWRNGLVCWMNWTFHGVSVVRSN